MIVEINTEFMLRAGLSADQYIMLMFLYEGKLNSFEYYLASNGSTEDLNTLHEKGYLLNYSEDLSVHQLIVSRKNIGELLGYNDSFFWELFGTYPIKVSNGGGGTRALRPTTHKSALTKKMQKKYAKKAKNKSIHEHIMRCLNAELWMRRKSGTLQYMQQLDVYLNQESWYNYEYLLEMSNEQKTNNYGQDLI